MKEYTKARLDRVAREVQREGTGFWSAAVGWLVLLGVVLMFASMLCGCAGLGPLDEESMDVWTSASTCGFRR